MNVEFLMAVRGRLIYEGATSLAAAMLDKANSDPLAETIEDSQKQLRGNSNKSPVDAVELMIAERVDAGEQLVISNQEGYGAARWISQLDLAVMPNPVPRAFVLYLAKALVDTGKYATMSDALREILSTKSFV